MKQKHRILSKKNKKVKQLMRRFQDDSEDEDRNQKKPQVQKQGQVIKKTEKNKKSHNEKPQFQQSKRKGSDRTNDSFDVQNQSDNQNDDNDQNQDGQKVKTTFSNVFSSILSQDVKKQSKINPIFSDFNKPLKKVKAEIRKDRENQLKKRIKELKESRGHVIPQNSPDGALYEKELKIQAAKGIIKILDAVKKYQEQEGIEN